MSQISLYGQRILVTRSPQQAKPLADKLAGLGGVPIVFPVINFTPLKPPELASILRNIDRFDWLIFTSANGVDFFWQQAGQLPDNLPKIGAVGSATAERLRQKKIMIDFIPTQFTGEQLVVGLGEIANKQILLPRAKIGRPEISQMMRDRGAMVTEIGLYDTVTAVPTRTSLAQLDAGFDIATFTSPSSVRNFLKILRTYAPQLLGHLQHIPHVPIGPVTAAELEKQGLVATAVPKEYTIDGLVEMVKKIAKEKISTRHL